MTRNKNTLLHVKQCARTAHGTDSGLDPSGLSILAARAPARVRLVSLDQGFVPACPGKRIASEFNHLARNILWAEKLRLLCATLCHNGIVTGIDLVVPASVSRLRCAPRSIIKLMFTIVLVQSTGGVV